MPYEVAIIGLGKIAHDQHLPVIAKNPDFKLAAIVSQRGLEVPGVPTFATPADLYVRGPKLDAVSICTPPTARYAIACEALAAGVNVMLEKPPAATRAELTALTVQASALDRVLFTTWHSQYNKAVDEARKRLADATVRSLDIEWKEDVRRWHPGQEWIWQAGGFGVFDPGINALSIATKIMPAPLFIQSSDLMFPANRDTPIAASLVFGSGGAPADLKAELDWRQTGEQTWDITIVLADRRTLRLTNGGARLAIDGKLIVEEPPAEYEAIYERFAELLDQGESDIDAAPLELVADAFMLGRRVVVEPFT